LQSLLGDTAVQGGGVYRVPMACNGSLGSPTLVLRGSHPTAIALLPGSGGALAIISATAMGASGAGKDTHLVDLATGTLISSCAAFGDGNAIVSAVSIMPDGAHALLADDGLSAGNRLAVVAVTHAAVTRISGLLSTPSPDDVVASVFGNAAIVLNGDSNDQIHVLAYDAANRTAPFVITGQMPYRFPRPQIPTTATPILVGSLRGTVFVGEVSAVRQLTFMAAGSVMDTAQLSLGGGLETIVGVVGVSP